MTAATDYLQAFTGATAGAAKAAAAMALVVQRAQTAGDIATAAPALKTVLAELVRAADAVAEIDRDTTATVRLVAGSASNVKAAALTAANQLRQAGQNASASTGRVESTYQAGTGSVVADASLANVVRAGTSIVYACTEAARQLSALAGKIKL